MAHAVDPGCLPFVSSGGSSYGAAYFFDVAMDLPITAGAGTKLIQAWWNVSWTISLNYTNATCHHNASVMWSCTQESLWYMFVDSYLINATSGAAVAGNFGKYGNNVFSDVAGWSLDCYSPSNCASGSQGANHTTSGKRGIDFSWNLSGLKLSQGYFLEFAFFGSIESMVFAQNATYLGGAGYAKLDMAKGSNGAFLSAIKLA